MQSHSKTMQSCKYPWEREWDVLRPSPMGRRDTQIESRGALMDYRQVQVITMILRVNLSKKWTSYDTGDQLLNMWFKAVGQLAAKPGPLSLIPGTYMKKTTLKELSSDLHMGMHAHIQSAKETKSTSMSWVAC